MRLSSSTNLVWATGASPCVRLRPRSGTEKHVTGLRPAGTKGRSFRGTTRFRRHCRRARCRRASLALADRCCPDNAGALRRSLIRRRSPSVATTFRSGAHGSIRSRLHPGLHQPPSLWIGGPRTTSPDHSLYSLGAEFTYCGADRSTTQVKSRKSLVVRAAGPEVAPEEHDATSDPLDARLGRSVTQGGRSRGVTVARRGRVRSRTAALVVRGAAERGVDAAGE